MKKQDKFMKYVFPAVVAYMIISFLYAFYKLGGN